MVAIGDQALHHGGDIRAAARRYGIPEDQWLDLSTGINPDPWPLPSPPRESWARLPEADDGLEAAAARYYGTDQLLATPGSQAALQWLPTGLAVPGRVGIMQPGYAEHAHAWRAAGHEVVAVPPEGPRNLDGLGALVVIQPNNPTGTVLPREQLTAWWQTLAARGGTLVVDEAFADSGHAKSMAPEVGAPGLVVLRSLGKFFGLAGLRVGFCLAPTEVRTALSRHLGPWAVNGIGRWAATRALSDRAWQDAARQRLKQDADRLDRLLSSVGLTASGACPLFRWVPHPDATAIEEHLARAAIRVRRFDEPTALRFGLPATESQWQRLIDALK